MPAATLRILPVNRRSFLKSTLSLAIGGMSSQSRAQASLPAPPKKASDRVALGKTGISASRLAIGTGSNGWNGNSNQTRKLGLDGMADLFIEAFDAGINFWDAADQYGSHPHLKAALQRIPRDKVVILTKTTAETADAMKADLDRFRSELGTDTIDIILLHCMEDPEWPKKCKGAMDVLSKAREAGIIRAHGVSCHSIGALKAAAACEWVQVDLARINPAGAEMDAPVDEVLPVLRGMSDAGKAVIGMKIFGAGTLVNRMDECLRFVLQQDYVSSFSLGFESRNQFREGLARLNKAGAA